MSPKPLMIAALGLWLAWSSAGAALGQDLKGYSVDLRATTALTFTDLQTRQHSAERQEHLKAYFGMSGNIFDYSDTTSNIGNTEHVGSVTAPGKAISLPRGRMHAWSPEPGKLTLIEKNIEGFVIWAMVIDPALTTCTLSLTLRPDPGTNRVMTMLFDGHTVQLLTLSARDVVCTVKRGNIFANDQ
ncbi:MAG TPA: hypothetical protein VNV38_11470 [Stellaceae bacterium]|jgi:hypothetical protein|nr:hypothetical protein [Stellaceae bacterium]